MTNKIKNAEMWDQRFDSSEYRYGKEPNDFLKNNFNIIPMGKVLCIGEGEGRNSVFLAKQGYEVTAIDYSIVGLKKTKQLAEENGVSVHTIHADLIDYDFAPNAWQGIVSIFCHIHKDYRGHVHRNCAEALVSDGVFLLEAYSPKQLQYGTGGPKQMELLMDLNEVKNELDGLIFHDAKELIRDVKEGTLHVGSASVIQIIGKKV